MPVVGIGVVPPDLDRQIESHHGAAGIPGDHRWLGSTAFEMAMVAQGAFDFGIFNGWDIWDVAAGIVLILGAGGVVLRPDPPEALGRSSTPSRQRRRRSAHGPNHWLRVGRQHASSPACSDHGRWRAGGPGVREQLTGVGVNRLPARHWLGRGSR